VKPVRQTTWDGKGDKPGWAKVPECEANVAPGYHFLCAWTKGTELRIHVEPIFHLEYCPGCGQKLTPTGSYYEPEIVDSRQRDLSCKLIVHRARYDCPTKDCPGRSDPLPGVDEKRLMTRRAINGMRRKAKRPASDIAKEYKVSDKTVSAVFLDFATEIIKKQKTTDRYVIIAFDEKNIGGEKNCVLHEAIAHTILIIFENDDPDTIKAELKTYENRSFVRYILVDGTKNYDKIFAELYPNAIVIRDIWHLLKELHKCRENVRRAAFRAAKGKARKSLRGRKDFWRDVSDTARWIGEQGDLLVPGPPIVSEANGFYFAFIALWRAARSREEAAQFYDYWVSRIPASLLPYFQPFINYVEPRRDEVFAYFELGWSTGGAESSNRNIEDEQNQGRSYSHEGLDARIRVQEYFKRLIALIDPGTELGPVISREEELSIEASIERSERMIQIRKRAAVAAKLKHSADSEPAAEQTQEFAVGRGRSAVKLGSAGPGKVPGLWRVGCQGREVHPVVGRLQTGTTTSFGEPRSSLS
jgi:transposase